jgi:hypothetical protein
MSEEQQLVEDIKALIVTLPEEDQKAIVVLADFLAGAVRIHGRNGRIALSLVGATIAASEEDQSVAVAPI